jgi:hypothetical protein
VQNCCLLARDADRKKMAAGKPRRQTLAIMSKSGDGRSGGADVLRPGGKIDPDIDRNLSLRLGARIGQFFDGLAIRIKVLVLNPIVEIQSIDVVNECHCRDVFSQVQRMIIEPNVIIDEHIGRSDSRVIELPLTGAPAWISTPSTCKA